MLAIVALFAVACGSYDVQPAAQAQAEKKAEGRNIFVQQNDIEFQNYNRRQQVADDPTTILWCTSAFNIPSSPLFTVPIVGKLTSGNKRPYPTERRNNYETADYFPEKPGPDGMYGSSGEYRYGFTPAGIYADWYNMATFCTTEPTVWQRESTVIVMELDQTLLTAHQQAREALKRGDGTAATKILQDAINKTKGGK